jgi:hypothetical protein
MCDKLIPHKPCECDEDKEYRVKPNLVSRWKWAFKLSSDPKDHEYMITKDHLTEDEITCMLAPGTLIQRIDASIIKVEEIT